jgi:two-component system, sensor histidine kinase and response regulator
MMSLASPTQARPTPGFHFHLLSEQSANWTTVTRGVTGPHADTLRLYSQQSQYEWKKRSNPDQDRKEVLKSESLRILTVSEIRKYDSARINGKKEIEYYHKKLLEAQQKGMKEETEEIYRRLAAAYADQGNFRNAYEYAQQGYAQHDSLLRSQMGSMASNLHQMKIRAEVNASTQIANTTMVSSGKKNLLWSYLLFSSALVCLFLAFMLYRNSRRTRAINRQLLEQNQEILQQQEMLMAQRDHIEEKSRKMEMLNTTKDKFFSIVAHDLKGPLNSLSSFSNLLATDLPRLSPQEIKIIAQELNKSVKNTSRLTENLLTWARLQMNSLHHYPAHVDLSKLLEDNLSLFLSTAQQKDIQLYTLSPPGLKVFADESQVRFILRNLTANALKFTRTQGFVRISAHLENEEVKIAVTDNGVGITTEVIERIFRIDSKHSTIGTAGEKGTGLGLVLCKEFVEKNGGRIEVSSEPGKGSTFAVYLQKADELAQVAKGMKEAGT